MKKIILFLLVLSPSVSMAIEQMPKCFERTGELPIMNSQVVQFKQTMPNLKKIQAFVKVNFVSDMPSTDNDYGRHQHFIVSLSENKNDASSLIEISHSMNGYTYPTVEDLKAGPIYICGEYSTTRADGFPKITKFTPSKTGAMLHWTHQAGRGSIYQPPQGHPNGWIYANGKIFGKYGNLD